MRVLVVTNITPDEAAPWRGQFVRDQVDALRRAGVDVELYSFPAGTRQVPAAPWARSGASCAASASTWSTPTSAWRAGARKLAGARPLVVTFHGTDVRHPVDRLPVPPARGPRLT